MEEEKKCTVCDQEYMIESKSDIEPIFCPFCGSETIIDDDLEEELVLYLEDEDEDRE